MIKIYCLMVSGKPLSDSCCKALYHSALGLVRNGNRKCKIVHDDVRGVVTTEFKSVHLNCMHGYAFNADVVTDKGITKVHYLVRDEDLEDGAQWN